MRTQPRGLFLTGDAAGRSHELFAVTQSFDPDHDDRLRWSARLSVALHLITAVILLFGSWWPWWATERTPAMSARPFEVTFLHPSDDMASPVLDAAERDVDRVWARRQAPTAADDDEAMGPSSTTVDIAGYVINLEKFLPGTEMFPFLTTELGLDPVPVTRSHGIEQWPFGIGARDAASSGMPPLLISDTDAQAIVDELWSRRSRWDDFGVFTDLISSYNPNEGRLPGLLQAHLAQNMLQPYASTFAPDPQLWVMLEIAAEHGEFIAFAKRHINEHPSTRVSTELLFLLDELAQGNRSALTALLEIDMETELYWTRSFQSGAFALLDRIRRRIEMALDAGGLDTLSDIDAAYDLVRLGLLSRIVETSPSAYRVNDALYLIGALYWGHGRRAEATSTWQEMQPDHTDSYVLAATDVLAGLGNAPAIDAALEAEHRRWVDFSFDRLRRFGFGFQTF